MAVAFLGDRTEVTRALEDSLRGRGIHVKRFASTTRATELTSPGRIESYNESAVRYIVEVDASVMDRCFGGGFLFNSIRVELTDTRQNEVVMSFKSKGYSEKCQPMSGTIFGDITRAIASAWSDSTAKVGS